MAGAIVHKEFFKECINQTKIKNIDNINNLNIFAQGHDLLLYASPLSFFKNRNISLILSNYKFKEFVYKYLKISAENSSFYQDKSVKSFLYGYISHHILDSYFHPFIMQYALDYLPKKHKPWLHGEIETLYDTLFITKKLGFLPSTYKVYKDFYYYNTISEVLISNIDMTICTVYNIKNCGQKFRRAFQLNSGYMRLYRYDRYGLKKKFATITNPIVRLGADKFFYDESRLPELKKYMNINHKKWINTYSNLSFTDSFEDIYAKALYDTVTLINEIEVILEKGKVNRDMIYDIVPNCSAITGAKCGIKLPFINYNSD